MLYRHFCLSNYKGIDKVNVSLVKNDLVLLLGLNESGKTTILKAIESFDYRNDPSDSSELNAFLASIRNKADVRSNTPAIVTADIGLDSPLTLEHFENVSTISGSENERELLEAFLREVNKESHVAISRVFPFKDGNPQSAYYRFDSSHPFAKRPSAQIYAEAIVGQCPFILYFEDFQDLIPEQIYVIRKNDAFNEDWYDIIDGLFYNTNDSYSISEFNSYYRPSKPRHNDARTVLRQVNMTFNEVYTRKWQELSGVEDIDEIVLEFNASGSKYFFINIRDTDGTTYYVHERSKGARWYLSFLMKTEFRRKKLRKDGGKPVYLIDEPASNLHATAQQNILSDFEKLVEDTSVIYSTHSQYLISLRHVKHTYVVRRDRGVIAATRWSDFLKENPPDVTYYQPLADHLQLVPNTFDVPWNRAIITEGPSDMHVLEVMHDVVVPDQRDYVIYPGTSATKLDPLISLNMGWAADFKVLLDSDKTGKKWQKRYMNDFELSDKEAVILPEDNSKIESYFSSGDKRALYELAFGKVKKGRVAKKEFATIFGILREAKHPAREIEARIDPETVTRFKELFELLAFS